MKWINTAGEEVWGGVFMCFSVRCGRFWRQQQSSLQLDSVVEACDHRQHLSEVQNPKELRGTSSHGGTEWEQPQPTVTQRKALSAPPKRCTCSTPAAHICFNSFRILTKLNRALLCTFNAFRFQRRVLVWVFFSFESPLREFSPLWTLQQQLPEHTFKTNIQIQIQAPVALQPYIHRLQLGS